MPFPARKCPDAKTPRPAARKKASCRCDISVYYNGPTGAAGPAFPARNPPPRSAGPAAAPGSRCARRARRPSGRAGHPGNVDHAPRSFADSTAERAPAFAVSGAAARARHDAQGLTTIRRPRNKDLRRNSKNMRDCLAAPATHPPDGGGCGFRNRRPQWRLRRAYPRLDRAGSAIERLPPDFAHRTVRSRGRPRRAAASFPNVARTCPGTVGVA
jgi:hypothetical protein